jgi:hypothetical protein
VRQRLWYAGLSVVLISLVIGGCSKERPLAQGILGRWQVNDNQGIGVPHSFFWLSMDWVEFREDGTALALIDWPPGVGSEIRLNATTRYRVVGDRQVEFVGSCRHADPCTGVYTTTLSGDKLEIWDVEGRLTLTRMGPAGQELPPTVVGPSPSPTPAATE